MGSCGVAAPKAGDRERQFLAESGRMSAVIFELTRSINVACNFQNELLHAD